MTRVLIPMAIAVGLFGSMALGDTAQDRIVSELRDEGFTRIEISRTLLGRTRILAENSDFRREIVLNPASGVILRDFVRARDGDGGGTTGSLGHSGARDGGSGFSSGSSGSGSASSGRDDSDGDDDDGSGSSGSASGSSGGGSDDSDDDNDDDGDSGGSSGSGSDSSGGDSDDSDDDDDDD